jgi:DNA polymerase I
MNKLIYGKNDLDRIVSIEVQNETATVFRELEDGSIDVLEVPHKFWILSDKQHTLDGKWVKLNGNQHYKYGRQYTKLRDYLNDKNALKKKNADIFTLSNPAEAMMVKDGYTFFKGMVHDKVSVLCFDIEGTGLEHNEEAKVLLISNTYRSVTGEITKRLFCYDDYENDAEMIDAWAAWVREIDPSIMAGHYIYGYDLPYLNYCHSKYSDEGIKLGREGKALSFNKYESKFRIDGTRDLTYFKANIFGRQVCDTMFLAYRYDIGRKYDSYGLKYIIEKESLTKAGRVFYDASKIRENYKIPEEWEKIKSYCIDDGDDALSVFDLCVPPFFYMTQMIPKPFQLMVESASGSQLNVLMIRSYLQDRHSIPKATAPMDFEGAISFGEPGIYENAVSLDIASLYPSIMLQYNVFNKEKDPNNHMLQFLEYMRGERLKNKKLAKETGNVFYKHLDGSYKILINSLYGFLGATGLHYNYPAGAAEVTRRGREILTQSIEWAKERGFTVPKGDTDSITIWDRGDRIPEIETIITELNNTLPEQINFELDAEYDSIVVFKAKNYAYREGEKISTKGSAIKASTKCPALKEFIKKVLDLMLYNKPIDEIVSLYNQYVIEIDNITDMKRWSARKTYSSTMEESERTNETKVMDALEGSDYREGDRFFCFYLPDDSLCLVENFKGEYNKTRLLKNLFNTIEIFDTVIPMDKFKNYALKKNANDLEELCGRPRKEKVKKTRPKKEKVQEVSIRG